MVMPLPTLLDPSTLSAADELISEAFGYPDSLGFLKDFPIWAEPHPTLRFGIVENDQLLSHAGIRTISYHDQNSSWNLGLIGAVATRVSVRGQGYSSKLLQHLIQIAPTLQIDWLILWGSEHDFYKKFGFGLDGLQFRIDLRDLQRSAPSIPVTIHTGYSPRILDQLIQDSGQRGLGWRSSDQAWLQKQQTVRWLWTEQPFAFAGSGRGMDLTHLVHEMGGETRNLEAILSRILIEDPQAQLLTHPAQWVKPPQSLWIQSQTPKIQERLCLSKPISARAIRQGQLGDDFWISGLQSC